MDAGICQNGLVLRGKDLQRYCKRKGLCPRCARVPTHKRKGKILNRNKWKPLTVQSGGEYLVYKGYCIQPTCYTLDQAMESLGEKPRRSSIVDSLRSMRPVQGTHYATATSQEVPTRRTNGESTEQITASHPRLSHQWSHDLPLITLPSSDTTDHSVDGKCPAEEVTKDCVGKVKDPVCGKNHTDSTPRKGTSNNHETSSTMKMIPGEDKEDSKKKRDEPNYKKGLKKLMALLPNKDTGSELSKKDTCSEPRQTDDEPTLPDDSSLPPASSSVSLQSVSTSSSDEMSASSDEMSACLKPLSLPGKGFLSHATEGGYRAAREALDVVADGRTSPSQLRTLCLKSKKFDHLDIEMVAVSEDESPHYFHQLMQQFSLDEGRLTNEEARENEMVFDFSGLPTVRLSQVYSGSMEQLELEANLDQYNRYFDLLLFLDSKDEARFETRAALEAEIARCRLVVSVAEQSQNPDAIQLGIEAKERLENLLLPLRKVRMSRRRLEREMEDIAEVLNELDNNGGGLDRRYELATEKTRLMNQLKKEIIEEEQQKQELNTNENQAMKLRSSEPKIKTPRYSFPLNETSKSQPSSVDSSLELRRERSALSEPSALSDTARSLDTTPSHLTAPVTEVRMSVFQSAPLAYIDPATGTHHECPLLDFEYEARALTQSLKDAEGANIHVEFDIATTDRLSAFLAKSESRVMHLSCHGHPEYLALENGFGGMQILPVRDLKRFIGAGAGNLEVVFVSACHSKAAGKAFLDAGIKHVICCRQDDKFRDEGAIEFARGFYRALALNNTLKQAFKMAREAMRVSPMVLNSKAEYDKFILLPELPENDPYHDVRIFSKSYKPITGMINEISLKPKGRILPRIPQFFVGREKDMYMVVEALRSNDIISIQGPPGIGKASLAAATVRYIEQRRKSFLFDEIFWLPVQKGAIHEGDTLYLDLSKIMYMMLGATERACQSEETYQECWGRVVRQLHDKRILLVIHGNRLKSEASRKSLRYFLSDLLKVANAKVIIVGVPGNTAGALDSAVLNIEALDYDATVLAFGRLVRSSKTSGQTIISSLTSFLKSKQGLSQEKLVSWRKRIIFGRIGNGVPAAIRRAALDISEEDLLALIGLAQRPMVSITSRYELDVKIGKLERDEAIQLKEKNFLLVRDIQNTMEELQCLRENFPTLEELRKEDKQLNKSLQSFIMLKQYDHANQVQQRLMVLQQQIDNEMKQEKDAKRIQRLESF